MNTIETIISLFMKPFQRLENSAIQLLTLRDIDTGSGFVLDVIGRVVNQARAGLADDVYKRYLRARIATNRSTGKREELLHICRLILGDPAAQIFAQKQFNTTVFLKINNVAVLPSTETALAHFMEQAASNGVRLIVQSCPTVPTSSFKFSGGGRPTGPGFGSAVHPGTGGLLSDMQD